MQKDMQFLKLSGHSSWSFTHTTDRVIKTNVERGKVPQTQMIFY